ncbi:MAG: beta-ketoacyl synthase N-terminal-like domain-containing protein [Bacteroidetes bacterium]|nr:beta-ketoacyl synthase N-terminal-like domain-containing protein [Bacteroidota bacterium]
MQSDEIQSLDGKVAIVGMACRLPGAKNIYEYWKNLLDGLETLSTFTDEDLIASGVDPGVFKQPNYIRSRGIINGAEYFDAEFFGYTPREAELMDPQQRIFLECAWHALEDAGCDPYNTKERIGVFGGTGTPLHLVSTMGNSWVRKNASGASIVTSNDKDYVTTRVSYKLNLTGPSVNVQCACSTSMVAVVLGINSLMNYQSDLIIAGGATIEIPEKHGYIYQAGGMESADGHCRTFDKDANGTVFSRGCGVVILKRLEDAIRDHNTIYAVILGGAINNDGNKKIGFTAPSVEGQVEVITEAIALSEISADTITYVEAHGTATPIGDPIEVTSLSEAFGQYSNRKQYCAIGSVKTNIGHTDIASGAASLIKTALCLKNRQIPASLHFNEANPKIDFQNSPFFVNTQLRNWQPENGMPLRALVNAFGVGGTNACIILEEAPAGGTELNKLPCDLILVSGRSHNAVIAAQAEIKAFLEAYPDIDPHAIAFTSRYGRHHFLNGAAIPFRNREELLSGLGTKNATTIKSVEKRPVVFMFPGQGNQYIRMGLPLYETQEVFRKTIDECAEILKEELGFDIRDILFPSAADEETAALKINETYITQPALFMVSYAQAQLLISLGIKPDMLIGHSVGEYVAATISGVFSLKDALKAVARRGRLVQDLPIGAMLAILLTEEQLGPMLPKGLEIAVLNSPGLCVVSGPVELIDSFAEELNKTKTFNKKIPTSHAFHSAMMEPALPAFAKFFKEINLSPPTIPIASTVTGQWLSPEESTNPDFWVNHVRKTVRFADAAKLCLDAAPAVFIESGPGQSLESAVKRQLVKDNPHGVISTIPVVDSNTDPLIYFYSALGQIWANGDYFKWNLFDKTKRKLVSYPGYPFERKPYIIDFSHKDGVKAKSENKKKSDINQWFYIPGWKRSAPPQRIPVNGMAIADLASEMDCWLLFSDELGLCREIANELNAGGLSCFTVKTGLDFAREKEGFTIDPGRKEHYIKLIKSLKSENWNPANVIFAWNYSKAPVTGHLAPIYSEQLAAAHFYSPLYLEQALISEGFVKNQFLLFVVNHLFDVTGEEVLAPEKALCAGAARVIGQEHPGIISRMVDLPAFLEPDQLKELASTVISECRLASDDTIVAYRHGYRWVEDYTQVCPESGGLSEKSLTDHGVYFITGGISGVGMELAKFIARTVKSTLVLTHRSPLPQRIEWPDIAKSAGRDDRDAMRVRDVMELESLGATVILAQLDASDYEGTKNLVHKIEKEHGPIRGVLHSAGMPGAGVIALKEKELADLVLKSKFHGTLILHDIFRGRKLDFFFLFSSVSSIFGEAARIDYCGSNSFMDSFAQYRKRLMGDGTLSINWGQWGVVGMAASWEKAKAEKKQLLQSGKLLKQTDIRNGIRLELRSSDNDQDIYQVDIDPERDWVLNSHLLSGKPAFLGISTLEILNQYVNIKNPAGHLEVLNFSFVTPLIYDAGISRNIRLLVKPSGDALSFRISSKEIKGESAREVWMDHVKGEFNISSGLSSLSINIQELSKRIGGTTDNIPHFLELLNEENRSVLKYGNRWDCKRSAQSNGKEFIIEVKLRDEFLDDLKYFTLHPAMLDVATSSCIQYVDMNLYLPYSYKNVKVHLPLPAHFWCHLKISEDWKAEDEELKFEVEIADKENRLLLSIGQVSFRRLKQNFGSFKNSSSKGSSPKPVQETSYFEGKNDILPDEGVEVFKRLLNFKQFPQLVISTTNLNQDILEERPSYKKWEKQEKEEDKQESASTYERPQLSTPFEAPSNEIENAVAGIWKGILGIEKIGVNDTFMELGGNSLLAIQTISNIADEFDLELQPNVFFENPTIKGLSDRIVEMIIAMKGSENIEAMLKEMENEQ